MKLGSAMLMLVAACSPAPMPVSQSSGDPSSPSAPEGLTAAVVASAASVRAPAESSGHEHHHHGSEQAPSAAKTEHEGHAAAPAASDAGTQGVVYVCPMHPEVTSNAPGICPKCNMKLVPKK
jgi:hypothetical protein